jgi:predicted glycogen debranching enzyme
MVKMNDVVRRITWPGKKEINALLTHEWLVTNGVGGYASGTLAGVSTRRFHGLLIAALPAPLGRIMILNQLTEHLLLPDGSLSRLCGEESKPGSAEMPVAEILAEFRLEMGLPVWRYEIGDLTLEKRILMPYLQNTVHITYQLLSASEEVTLLLRPAIQFRPHEGSISGEMTEPYKLIIVEDKYEI